MCEVCNVEINNDKLIQEGFWNTLYIERDREGYYIRAVSDGDVTMKLEYCPKCGRKLDEE